MISQNHLLVQIIDPSSASNAVADAVEVVPTSGFPRVDAVEAHMQENANVGDAVDNGSDIANREISVEVDTLFNSIHVPDCESQALDYAAAINISMELD